MSLEFAVVSRRDFVKINGECHWLWRLVNQEGEVLESYDTKRQNRKSALGSTSRRTIHTCRSDEERAPYCVFGARKIVEYWTDKRKYLGPVNAVLKPIHASKKRSLYYQ